MDRETKAHWRKMEKAYEAHERRWRLPIKEREIREAIDTRLEEIRFDYACVDAYNQPVDIIRANLVGIILCAREAQQLCKELEAL